MKLSIILKTFGSKLNPQYTKNNNAVSIPRRTKKIKPTNKKNNLPTKQRVKKAQSKILQNFINLKQSDPQMKQKEKKRKTNTHTHFETKNHNYTNIQQPQKYTKTIKKIK